VVNARTWFTLFIISLGTVAATASCGSDEATGGSGGNGSIISGGGRAGSVGRAGSGGGSNVGSTALGTECSSDAQCGDGLICAKANGTLFGGAGPSKGMCTMPCEPGGTECGALKAGAECFDFSTTAETQGYCLDACEQDTPVDVTSKCAGRSDFVCVDLGEDAVLPFCVPHCRSDAECGTGLFCDKSSLLGLCSKTKPPAGDPVGSDCTPSATSNTCEGYCIRTSADGVTPVTGSCVELCSGGSECMYGSGSNPAPGGFCGGALSDPFGAIDLGYCLPNCSCSGDCKLPGDLCRKWPDADRDLADVLGAPGVCYPVVAQSVELTCGEGGAGGAGGAGGESAGGAAGDSAGGAAGDSAASGAGGVSGSN
jgi:hypothetical protein